MPPPRRLMTSRSAGDLLSLNKPVEVKLTKKEKKNSRKDNDTSGRSEIKKTKLVSLPDPEASVVCGELYRLSLFGVWCRLWLELRLSYLLFFYDREDSLPIDVVHLKGYSVHKAPECDHLEGLFPIKIFCKDSGKVFFFCAENEECRVKWMAALWRACATKPSLTIEGLNLEPELNGFRANNELPNNWSIDRKLEESDTLSELRTTKDGDGHKATAICNVYDRMQELTEHEVLRMSTYYMQRRLSTQIKMQTLQDQLQEGTAGLQETRVGKKLHDLSDRLQVIESCKEETERAAEQKLYQLKTKKALFLRQLSQSNQSLAASCSEEEHEEPPITIITQTPDDPSKQVVLRKKNTKGVDKLTAIERHKTFSPGDWHFPSTPTLRKVGSVDDMQVKEKQHRRGPLSFLSRRRTRSIEREATQTPITPPPSPSPTKSHNKSRFFFRSLSHQEAGTTTPSGQSSASCDDNEVFGMENVDADSSSSQHQHHGRQTKLKSTIKRIFSFNSRHHSYS